MVFFFESAISPYKCVWQDRTVYFFPTLLDLQPCMRCSNTVFFKTEVLRYSYTVFFKTGSYTRGGWLRISGLQRVDICFFPTLLGILFQLCSTIGTHTIHCGRFFAVSAQKQSRNRAETCFWCVSAICRNWCVSAQKHLQKLIRNRAVSSQKPCQCLCVETQQKHKHNLICFCAKTNPWLSLLFYQTRVAHVRATLKYMKKFLGFFWWILL